MDARDPAPRQSQKMAHCPAQAAPAVDDGMDCRRDLHVTGRPKTPHLVTRFLDYLEQSAALLVLNPDETLLVSAKELIRRQAEQGLFVCGLPQAFA